MPSTCFRMPFYMLMIPASMVLIMASMVLIVDVEKINDLIIFSTLCCKYGVSILVLLHWVAYYCIQCIAYIVNISSWKLTLILAISAGIICYVGYTVCCQCIALTRKTGKMFFDMIVTSIRNAVVVLMAVGLAAFGIFCLS
jgi:hypothetical protein